MTSKELRLLNALSCMELDMYFEWVRHGKVMDCKSSIYECKICGKELLKVTENNFGPGGITDWEGAMSEHLRIHLFEDDIKEASDILSNKLYQKKKGRK